MSHSGQGTMRRSFQPKRPQREKLDKPARPETDFLSVQLLCRYCGKPCVTRKIPRGAKLDRDGVCRTCAAKLSGF